MPRGAQAFKAGEQKNQGGPGWTKCGSGTDGDEGELTGREDTRDQRGPTETQGDHGGPMVSKGLTFASLLFLFVVRCSVQVGSLCSHLR